MHAVVALLFDIWDHLQMYHAGVEGYLGLGVSAERKPHVQINYLRCVDSCNIVVMANSYVGPANGQTH
jgi:hypothetical protein